MPDHNPPSLRQLSQLAADQVLRQTRMVKTMAKAGVIRPHNPVRLAAAAKTILDKGIGFAG